MAAGASSRFVPLSYEKPKGLLNVKGEILIERQIRQLQEANIFDITIVVGYKAELFEYLIAKYGVSIVLNEDYKIYNNTSSLIRVIDKLEDTYICSSDNYFTHNVFIGSPTHSYYSALYSNHCINEYFITYDNDSNITKVDIGPNCGWYMIGHVFFNREFSNFFRSTLLNEYSNIETKMGYWEDVYIRHIDQLPKMKIHRYEVNDIKEFDSLEELRNFDSTYINHSGCKTLEYICKELNCEEENINNIISLKDNGSFSSFYFTNTLNGCRYIYRHLANDHEKLVLDSVTNKK